MKTDEELKKVAENLHAGRIFSDRHVENPEDLRMVFMVLALAGPELIKKMQEDDISFIYEYIDKAGPRSINGMPSFFSHQGLTKTETAKMFEYYNKIKAAVENVT